nr:hypothetical protein [Tanacetum cinerariifolium]
MANVNVLRPGVLDVIATQSNSTTIIIIQGNLVEVKAIVSELGSHQEYLSTTPRHGDVFCLGCRDGSAPLFLRGPDNQFIALELSTLGCASSYVLTTCMICICIGPLQLMLMKTSRKICQVIKTAGEELLLPSQIDAAGSVTSSGTVISFTDAFSASPSDKKLESHDTLEDRKDLPQHG